MIWNLLSDLFLTLTGLEHGQIEVENLTSNPIILPMLRMLHGSLSFMMFQAEMEMKMYLGEVEGDNSLETNVLSSAICIETLVNMRTVYSKEKC